MRGDEEDDNASDDPDLDAYNATTDEDSDEISASCQPRKHPFWCQTLYHFGYHSPRKAK